VADKFKINYERDVAPVTNLIDVPAFLVITTTNFAVKDVKELIDYAKKNPGKLSFGSAGNGTSTHMRIEMLNYRAKVEILHVPYRGSADALNDLLAGNIQMMNEINPLPHVRAGKLILLNLNAPKRSAEWPGIPTLTELGYPNSDVPSWYFDPGADRDACGHRAEVQRQSGRDRQDRRHAADADQAFGRPAVPDAGRDGRVSEGRHQGQRGSDQGCEHQAGVRPPDAKPPKSETRSITGELRWE